MVETLEQEFAADPDIDAFLPFLAIGTPVTNLRTGDAKPAIQVTGVDFARLDTVGGLTSSMAESIRRSSDRTESSSANAPLKTFAPIPATRWRFTAPTASRRSPRRRHRERRDCFGVLGLSAQRAGRPRDAHRTAARAWRVRENEISSLPVALHGGVRDTLLADPRGTLNAYLVGEGSALFADTGANHPKPPPSRMASKGPSSPATSFTLFFLVLGLFSMAAGVMLIFMIFVMLAAERRSEMGMASSRRST